MPCFHPRTAWRTRGGEITFKPGQGVGFSIEIPCGGCAGCRIERSRDWALRCVHEAQMHTVDGVSHNCFLTLTYDDAHIPEGHSLVKKDFQDFIKRLRKRVSVHDEEGELVNPLRYYHCGEYGEQYGRPHYHALIFGWYPVDRILWRETKRGRVYTSQIVQETWGKGFTSVGDVTFQSAAYVARYIMKKQTGQAGERARQIINPETGEVFNRIPEYTTMSRAGGIGASWFDKFHDDVFPEDCIVHEGKKFKVPRFYTKRYEGLVSEEALEQLKLERKRRAAKHVADQTPARLAAREEVQIRKIKLLKRDLK